MDFGYPKLKWPLNRRGLNEEAGNILLAYDMIWRLLKDGSFDHLDATARQNIVNDACANLCNLGVYIHDTLGRDRFEESDEDLSNKWTAHRETQPVVKPKE